MPDVLDSRFREAVLEVVSEPPVEIDAATTIIDIGLDSLSTVMLLTVIEDRFQAVLPDDALQRGGETTLGDLCRMITAASPASGMS